LTNELKGVSINRDLSVGIVDVHTGVFVDFTHENITAHPGDLVNVMYASFAFAGFFPPVKAFNSDWFDGSAVWDLDIFSSIN
jgi:predicted acylesterase/phospholipase RssA